DSVNTENKYPSSSDKTLIEKELNEESVDDLGLLHELVSEFVGERYDENEKQCKNTNKQLYLDYGNEKDDNDSQVPVDNKHINKNNKPPDKTTPTSTYYACYICPYTVDNYSAFVLHLQMTHHITFKEETIHQHLKSDIKKS
ncbi:hypothetical protein INT46_004117, partial [Mucor plumbeus]